MEIKRVSTAKRRHEIVSEIERKRQLLVFKYVHYTAVLNFK